MQAASPTYATPGRAFSNGVSAYMSRAPVELLEVFALEAPFLRGDVQRAQAIPITSNATTTRAARQRGTQRADAGWMGSFTAHFQGHSGSGSRLPRTTAIIERRSLCPQLTLAAAFRRSTFSDSLSSMRASALLRAVVLTAALAWTSSGSASSTHCAGTRRQHSRDRVLSGRQVDGDRQPRSDDHDLGCGLSEERCRSDFDEDLLAVHPEADQPEYEQLGKSSDERTTRTGENIGAKMGANRRRP
jgi:hypothetical protein